MLVVSGFFSIQMLMGEWPCNDKKSGILRTFFEEVLFYSQSAHKMLNNQNSLTKFKYNPLQG